MVILMGRDPLERRMILFCYIYSDRWRGLSGGGSPGFGYLAADPPLSQFVYICSPWASFYTPLSIDTLPVFLLSPIPFLLSYSRSLDYCLSIRFCDWMPWAVTLLINQCV